MVGTGGPYVWPRISMRCPWLIPSPSTNRPGNASPRVAAPALAASGSRAYVLVIPVATTSFSVQESASADAARLSLASASPNQIDG